MKFTYFMGTSFTKLRWCFHEIPIIRTLFPPLREKIYALRVKPFAEASAIFTYAVSESSSTAERRPRSAFPRRPTRRESVNVKSGL